uniref:UPAR/Ly6 domain-containing protein n=1 Tax=Rhabditophanes sp. KR3021 TaxID=114890 RepID=A0AC35U1N8_9BILA
MLPLPPKADGCTKLSFVGYFISAYCNVCQCSGQFCNVEWKNSEPITCVSENTGLALKGASNEALTTKMCAFNEPCSSISATVRSRNTGNSTNPPPAPLMTMQGCSMELNSAFTKGNFASYPDNSCYSYFADLGVAVDTDLVPTLCSCNTPNCTPVQTVA